jgi:hypothetical protein
MSGGGGDSFPQLGITGSSQAGPRSYARIPQAIETSLVRCVSAEYEARIVRFSGV